jgi:hypothetical protein
MVFKPIRGIYGLPYVTMLVLGVQNPVDARYFGFHKKTPNSTVEKLLQAGVKTLPRRL